MRESERARERGSVCVCVCKGEGECVSAWPSERERTYEYILAYRTPRLFGTLILLARRVEEESEGGPHVRASTGGTRRAAGEGPEE